MERKKGRGTSDANVKREDRGRVETFASLVEALGDAFCLLEMDGTMLCINPAFENLTGFRKPELLGKNAFDLIHTMIKKENVQKVEETFSRALEGKITPQIEDLIVTKDGREIVISVTASFLKDEGGKSNGIIATFRDVTESRRVEEENRRRMKQLIILHQASREILQAGNDLEKVYVAIHNATSQLMPAEAFVISLLNEERKEIEAVYLIDRGGRWPSSMIPMGRGISGRVISTGKSMYIRDVEKISLDSVHFGHPENVRSILAVPLPLGDEVMGMIATESYSPEAFTHEDKVILEMLAAHAAPILHNATLFEEAKRSNLQLEFVNDLMSHDLTNINQVTLGYLDFLKETELSEKQRRFVETILYSTRRNMRLIENVKKLWESSRVSPKPIDADKCIQAAMKEINVFPGKKVELNYVSMPFLVLADEYLKDVMGNLIDNAIKFDSSEEVIVDISVVDEGDECRISVADRGKGIPDAYKDAIFSRLERLEKGVRGTGLGLHLVKTIISLYGGEVWVENNSPAGSIFNIRLPRVKDR